MASALNWFDKVLLQALHCFTSIYKSRLLSCHVKQKVQAFLFNMIITLVQSNFIVGPNMCGCLMNKIVLL